MNNRFYDYILSLPLVDSHEMLPPRYELRPRRDVVAELLSDAPAAALTAAGLGAEQLELALGDRLSVREKWRLVSRYWTLASHTTACRAAELAARELYGLDGINDDTIEIYDAAFRSTFGANRYEYILKERCNIEFALLFDAPRDRAAGDLSAHSSPAASSDADERYFKPASDIFRLVSPASAEDALAVGRETGVSASAFDDYLEACTRKLKQIAKRCNVIRCSGAPLPLPASYSDARNAFAAMMGDARRDGREAVHRYVYRYILSLASELGMTVRLDDGGTDSLSHAEMFTLYPKLRFEVLVSVSPGRRELSRYAAVLPNVYANLCHVPEAAGEYLSFTPYSKLICFGGGCTTVDAVYGRAQITRETLSHVLTACIASGMFERKGAEAAARALLYENARELYRVHE